MQPLGMLGERGEKARRAGGLQEVRRAHLRG